MTKLLFVTAALAALIASPALAADIRRPPPPVYKAPPPPPVLAVYNWSGCYLGGHAGGLFATKEWTGNNGADLGSHDANGYLAGAQVGCNIQVGNWVFGVQGDYAYVDAEGSNVSNVNRANRNRSKIESLSSVTGRFGLAYDRFLGYVKGGAAWEEDNYDISSLAGVTVATASELRSGYTVGVGAEYAVTNNVTWFVEYNFYDFGTRSNTFSNNNVVDINEVKNVVKGGFNFKFDWGGAPMGARY
jgi:outer membrane immunogenic protein